MLDELNHLLGHLLSQVDASHLDEEGLGGGLGLRDEPLLPVEGQRGRKAEPWLFGSQSHQLTNFQALSQFEAHSTCELDITVLYYPI